MVTAAVVKQIKGLATMPDFDRRVKLTITKQQAETLWFCLMGHWCRADCDPAPMKRLMAIKRNLDKQHKP